jgi:hypothetical protein
MIENILAGAAVVVGLAAAYFAWRTIPPKRELTIAMRATPLLNRSDSNVDRQLRVVHEKLGDLADPQVVVLTIRNSGRAAIASAHYDANQPLSLVLGQPILQLMQPANKGGSGLKVSPPPSRVEFGVLEVGPGLIHRKQQLTFTVLVDGKPTLEVEPNLVDVGVKVTDPDPAIDRTRFWAGFGGGLVAAAAVWAGILTDVDPSVIVVAAVVSAVFGTVMVVEVWSSVGGREL